MLKAFPFCFKAYPIVPVCQDYDDLNPTFAIMGLLSTLNMNGNPFLVPRVAMNPSASRLTAASLSCTERKAIATPRSARLSNRAVSYHWIITGVKGNKMSLVFTHGLPGSDELKQTASASHQGHASTILPLDPFGECLFSCSTPIGFRKCWPYVVVCTIFPFGTGA